MKRIHLAIESIVAATLATAACGETTNAPSTFASNDGGAQASTIPAYTDQADFACAGTLPGLLDDLAPTAPFDFLEIRYDYLERGADGGVHYELGPDGGRNGSTQATKGTACATASDASACRAALDSLQVDGGWSPPMAGNYLPARYYIVYTRGDEVGSLTTPAAIAAVLGNIDTLGEARLVAYASEAPALSCTRPDVPGLDVPAPGWRRNADGSFEIIAFFDQCGSSVTRERYEVSAAGAFKRIDQGNFDSHNGSICGRRPDGLTISARRADDVGAYFAEIAWLEAAAVVAFRRVESDLRALAAPASLIAEARQAQADEIRHAREANELARAFGGNERPLLVAPETPRDRFAIALENAVEGCVRETYGALVAAYQARTARDPAIRRFFAHIAGDEARHAALSHEIAAWIEQDLDADERARIARAKESAFAELLASADRTPTFAGTTGLPTPMDARRLLEGLAREILTPPAS